MIFFLIGLSVMSILVIKYIVNYGLTPFSFLIITNFKNIFLTFFKGNN